MSRKCVYCNNEIAKEKRKGTQYCSMRCYHKHYQEQYTRHPKEVIVRKCRQCKEEFTTTDKRKLSCSRKCQIEYQNSQRKTTQSDDRKCPTCGKTFKPLQKRGIGKIYCSDRCRKLVKSKGAIKIRLSKDEYNEMFISQNGVCAICKQKENIYNTKKTKPKSLAVDHCHKTGAIRGLLCDRCNRALGGFRDNPNYLQSAINYLKKYSGGANVENN